MLEFLCETHNFIKSMKFFLPNGTYKHTNKSKKKSSKAKKKSKSFLYSFISPISDDYGHDSISSQNIQLWYKVVLFVSIVLCKQRHWKVLNKKIVHKKVWKVKEIFVNVCIQWWQSVRIGEVNRYVLYISVCVCTKMI